MSEKIIMKGWIIIAPDSKPDYTTLTYFKKDSISSFIENGGYTWAELKKEGWKCIKVELMKVTK